MDDYCIAEPYEARLQPEYFVDGNAALVYQPDVYRRAALLAERVGARTIVDVGAGSGDKLSRLRGPKLIALDFGVNASHGPERHPEIDWREYDAEDSESLPLDRAELQGALVICADVIEHIVRPERLLVALKRALDDGASVAIVSTPDRSRLGGETLHGPPGNRAHVREWTREELVRLVEREGFHHGTASWTRQHHLTTERSTIELVLARDPEVLAKTQLVAKPALPAGSYLLEIAPQEVGLKRVTFPPRMGIHKFRDRSRRIPGRLRRYLRPS